MRKTCILLFLMMFVPCVAGAQIASSEYVEQRIETTVSISGNQEITGVKQYTESPIAPTPALP